MIMKRLFWMFGLFVTVLDSVCAAPQLKIITLQHRFAEDLLSVIQPLAGPSGTVSGFNNQLIINAEPSAMADIEAALQSLDVQRRNWRITLSNRASNTRSETQTGVSGEIGRDVRVSVPDSRGQTRRGVNVALNERTQSWTQSGSMELQTMDGETAYLRIGKQIPYTETWIEMTRRHVRVVQDIHWRDVTTGFIVRPRLIGTQVDLEITPRLSALDNDGNIDFTELATHIRITPGEWIDLGGMLSSHDEVSHAILHKGDGSQQSSMQLRIKID